ncbi:hypothetical protein PFLUV_G00245300 [Perca fluviatilis]|uniref:Uncharacterized protein n=1 Tax=Perca fluviatilis TaxID=8168 RepID=A0A6A5DWX6_PERFL|nr:hypothetical protein PFLUV_G00245300 [Perca fluviatilis]
MTVVVNIFQYLFPALMLSIAVVLLCFYLHTKKKRAAYDVTIPTPQDDNTSSVYTISLSEDQAEEDRCYDRFPPRYSTVDHPPPYSLFDPKLTSIWPGGSPPAYEMYPVTLPLAPHYWMTPTGTSTSNPTILIQHP